MLTSMAATSRRFRPMIRVWRVRNPTQFVVQNAAVTATKTVAGTFAPGSTVTYTVTISNTGSGQRRITRAMSSPMCCPPA